MRLPETEHEYRNALVDAAEVGARKVLIDLGLSKPHMKLREAYRAYGERVVKRWIAEGLVEVKKDGPRNASVRIDRMQLESIAKTCNRATYLSTKEREEL